jgi:potassium efflux system protein
LRSLWSATPRALAIILFLCSFGFAQPAQPPGPFADQSQKLDEIRANLDQIEQTLGRKDLNDAALQDLRTRIDPLSRDNQAIIDKLQPQLDAIKARIDQLGPKPAATAPPESADVSNERADQQRQFDAIDGILKRGNLFAKQIEQDSDAIVSRRRDQFTRALFARTFSILDPRLWISVIGEAGRDWRATRTVASDWASSLRYKLAGWNALILLGSLLAVALAYPLVLIVARRVSLRDPNVHDPSTLRKATAAAWGALVDIMTPVAAALVVLGLARFFDLFNSRLDPLVTAVFDAVIRIAIASGIARAMVAPGLVNWRTIDVTEAIADRLYRLAIVVASVVSATKVLEALIEIIGAGLRASIALRGGGALVVALIAAFSLRNIAARDDAEEECLPPKVAATPGWRGPLRVVVWGLVATIIVSTLTGYNAFASFLVTQAIWVWFIGGTLYLLNELADEAICTSLRPHSPIGRSVMNSVGLTRESLDQIAVLMSGAITVALIVAAAMMALAPWGVESDDMFGSVRAAFFGFKVGEVTISLSSIIVSVILFGIAWGAARALQNWLESKFLPHTQLDAGLRNSIGTSIGYIGFLLAVALALGFLGLSFEKLAIVAGALSVGIGFGLQSIVNNFVSGLILLWERAIRVGDWVVVGDEQGYVRRINVRSTEIETFDRAMMIVPNSNLVSGVVKNWVRNDRVGRIKNPVTVAVDTNPEKVREALLTCAQNHELVQKFPTPSVMFTAMEGSLKFELICFVGDVEKSARVKSDLNFEMFTRLKDAGIAPFAPPTQGTTLVSLTDIDRLEKMMTSRSTQVPT